jgi:uncharacterized protein (TIGR02996 family)
MTDGDHLYRAILAHPDEDTPRLAYADWLDENAGPVRCSDPRHDDPSWPAARCGGCGGRHGESDGRRERAEFIRVQCRLAFACVTCTPVCSQEYGHAPPCELGLVGDLRRRERELFNTTLDGKAWLFPPPDGFDFRHIPGDRNEGEGRPHLKNATYRRGFVAEIRLTAAAFLGEVCERCFAFGNRRVINNPNPRHGSSAIVICPDCDGTGRTPGLAGPLFAAHPITKVVLTNKSPEETPSGWSWFDHGFADDSATITPDLFRHLSDTDGAQPGLLSARMTFATREAALDALSVALVAYGRRAAMLSD